MYTRQLSVGLATLIATASLTACGSYVMTPSQVPSPSSNQHRLTGTVLSINVPHGTDGYVALELQADGTSQRIAYFCSYGQPTCRLLEVSDRVSYTTTNGSIYVDYVLRLPED